MKNAGATIFCTIVLSSSGGSMRSETLDAYMRERHRVESFRSRPVDLNDDAKPELVVYATDAGHCGSGGCTMFVLSRNTGQFDVLSKTTIVQLPVKRMESSTNGWRDLSVVISGGGILPARTVLLPHTGEGYATNPTMPPAIPFEGTGGEILIDKQTVPEQ